MIKNYKIIPPAIPSAGLYYFTTDSGVKYEVRFGRKQNDLLCATIVFGVINEEYEGEEYVNTNKGEVYRVMNTIVEVVQFFRAQHPNIRSYEFTGEPGEGEDTTDGVPTKRIRMYHRYVMRIFGDKWNCNFEGNKITVYK
ncbi:MAG: hypothetical protein JKY53_04475 [Flavobacteriales bacterium]|nr:hypothetical protein [Flavobacteriales bacterium]